MESSVYRCHAAVDEHRDRRLCHLHPGTDRENHAIKKRNRGEKSFPGGHGRYPGFCGTVILGRAGQSA